MLGAIIGDIIGSKYEASPIKTKEFNLYSDNSHYTDDTVLTAAVASAIINNESYAHKIKDFGCRYPFAGYGKNFKKWLETDSYSGYNSFGNGSAMRVSPIAWAFERASEVLHEAKKSAMCTHNHPEGIKGAQAVALAIFLARKRFSKEEIKNKIENKFKYNLSRTVEEIRFDYSFDVTCQGSVPEAIICFLEASSFEDSIKNAVSLGGDSDTQAAIAGSIAEAYYGIDTDLVNFVLRKLDSNLLSEILSFLKKYNNNRENIILVENAINSVNSRYSSYLQKEKIEEIKKIFKKYKLLHVWEYIAKTEKTDYNNSININNIYSLVYILITISTNNIKMNLSNELQLASERFSQSRGMSLTLASKIVLWMDSYIIERNKINLSHKFDLYCEFIMNTAQWEESAGSFSESHTEFKPKGSLTEYGQLFLKDILNTLNIEESFVAKYYLKESKDDPTYIIFDMLNKKKQRFFKSLL